MHKLFCNRNIHTKEKVQIGITNAFILQLTLYPLQWAAIII